MASKDTDQVFVIVADCGGGDDHNPHLTLKSALARVQNETGIEIWKTTLGDYERNECGGPDYPDLPHTELVYECW